VVEFDYLAACQEAERLARRRTRRMQALVGVLAFGVVVALLGWLNEGYLGERLNWFTVMRPYMLANVRPYVLTAEQERALVSGASFRECAKDCPEMIVIPAREFTMGSPATERAAMTMKVRSTW
jgi:formylglycine-generating enzyme required for sulfatase activity